MTRPTFRSPEPQQINEGEGDYLMAGSRMLAGSGFRTSIPSHAESREYFGVPVVGLTLVDPRYYHLDTALAVLDADMIMYHPPAFSAPSRRRLARLYPDAITASDDDAAAFGLNAVSDGKADQPVAHPRVRADQRGPVRTAQGRRKRQVLHPGTALRGERTLVSAVAAAPGLSVIARFRRTPAGSGWIHQRPAA